ncbi:cytochrome c oxidase assembly protein [Actinomadura sp. DC4]|uniref:cytochrome c oxidase assembly protein n=1 Tax=Actinomadura sp. DC4 TaxID=3055069 RepID=UPI0025B16531|nr:cytochrome c oxidase assembly protein [Actinomadura sp. DC4]MDN3354088.1 cytochrome c oxidase assembly protein [Actinomadura sp. DC4]
MDMDPLAPLTWARAFTTWRFSPVTTVLLAAALLIYLAGVIAARRDGPSWPLARTLSFAGGLAVTGAAIMGSPGVYGDGGLFWLHMIEHLMLIMVAPWLLCLGHPMALLLRATSGTAGEYVEAVRRSRPARLLRSPIVGLALYIVILFGIHLSSFMDAMMDSPALMAVERLLYLGGGYLYFSRLLTVDRSPAALPYPLRLFSLFMGMSADTVVGVVLLQATHPPFPSWAAMHPSWGVGPLGDIHDGGAVMWIGGDGLMFAMLLVVGATWLLDRSPDAARAGSFLESARQAALAGTGHGTAPGDEDRARLRASGNVDEDDAALEAYNALLSRLNGPDQRR